MKIRVILPYYNASQQYKMWATEEEKIDFLNDIKSAVRCTLSYAALELVTYLGKLGFDAEVCDKGDFSITLLCDEKEGDEFEISQSEDGITIKGYGRAGVLYGVYEFLETQGIHWYAIHEEYVPNDLKELKMPEFKKYVYGMPIGRGFEFEGPLKEGRPLLVWMARNRFNISGVRPHTIPLQRKLCMKLKAGGHIFEAILAPDNLTPDGRTFLEAHKNWYGKRDGEITAENAQSVQFCVNEPDLLDYLADKLIERLKSEWKEADIIDVWTFDTWGGSCGCEACRKTGNGMDRIYVLLSHLRKRVDEAFKNGELDKNYNLVTDMYEGTDTIEPPLNPVPDNMLENDYIAIAPILRCYKHYRDDEECEYNNFYKKQIEGVKGYKLAVCEYYNVSKFEDMPLVFTQSMINDIRYYHRAGVKGFTYMHLPMGEWGVRCLTQYMLANLLRNPDCDAEKLVDEYFKNLYGKYADDAKCAYELCEKATEYSSSWRSWSADSLLSTLIGWNGYTVKEPLFRDSHLGDDAAEKGIKAADYFKQAADIMRKIRTDVQMSLKLDVPDVIARGVNPSQHQKFKTVIPILNRLSEDIRGLVYGDDCFRILALFTKYYECLHNGKDETDVWNEIYALANKMSEYTFSVLYAHPLPELFVCDALSRSGVKELFSRVLSARNQKLKG